MDLCKVLVPKKPPLKLNNRIYDLAYKPLKPSVALKDLKSKDCIHPAYSQNSDGTCFLRERQTGRSNKHYSNQNKYENCVKSY